MGYPIREDRIREDKKEKEKVEKEKVPVSEPKNVVDLFEAAMMQREADRLCGFPPNKEQIDELYRAYPRKINRGDLDKAWETAVFFLVETYGWTDSKSHDFLLSKVCEYARSPAGREPPEGQSDYRPSPASWLNSQKWADDPKAWQIPTGKPVNGNGHTLPKVKPLTNKVT